MKASMGYRILVLQASWGSPWLLVAWRRIRQKIFCSLLCKLDILPRAQLALDQLAKPPRHRVPGDGGRKARWPGDHP